MDSSFFNDNLVLFYQELLKLESCLIRFNSICEKMNDSPYYVPVSSKPIVHDFNARMTFLDIVYTYVKSQGKFDRSEFLDLFNKLLNSRLIIDLPCNFDFKSMIEILSGNKNDLNDLSDFSIYKDLDRHIYVAVKLMNEVGKDTFRELINDMKSINTCYKTAYGELIRTIRFQNALPYSMAKADKPPYYILEAYMLPFLEDYIPIPNIPTSSLCDHNTTYLCDALRDSGIEFLNIYQFKMIKEMLDNIKEPKVSIISSPTGSGKTYIFLVYMLYKLLKKNGVALVIYPTKSLARDQLDKFIKIVYILNKKIEKYNKKIHIYILDGRSKNRPNERAKQSGKLSRKYPREGEEFRGGIEIPSSDKSKTYVIKYHNNELWLSANGEYVEKIDWLSEYKDLDHVEEPAIIISNHSMLSLHLAREGKSSAVIKDILQKLHTLVIDEAHEFIDNRDKLDFLHFLLVRIFTYLTINELANGLSFEEAVKKFIKDKNFDLIISSATIEERNIIGNSILTTQIGGIDLGKIKSSQSKPDLTPLLRENLSRVFSSVSKEIYLSYYDTILNDINSNNVEKRLSITVLFFPSPAYGSDAPVISSIISSMLWSIGIHYNAKKTLGFDYIPHILVFVDSKETQRDIFYRLIVKGLKEDSLHKDKLLLLDQGKSLTERKKFAYDTIRSAIQYSLNQNNFDEILKYSNLQFFLKYDDLKKHISEVGKSNFVVHLPQQIEDILNEISTASTNLRRGEQFIHTGDHYYVLYHNADIEEDRKNKIEGVLSGAKNQTWNVAISTSTLELGVNLPSINFVFHYGAPPSSHSYIQRLGRSGRDKFSFRTSFGVIFLRNFGPDITYVDEKTAINNLYSLKKNITFTPTDKETLIRYGVLVYQLLDRLVYDRDIRIKILKEIINSYRVQSADKISEAIIKIYNNRMLTIRKLSTDMGNRDFGSLYSLSDIIEGISEKLESIHFKLSNSKHLNHRIVDNLKKEIEKVIEISQKDWNVLMTEDLFDFYKTLTECITYCEKTLKEQNKTSSDVKVIKKLRELRNLADDLLRLPLSSIYNNSQHNKVKIDDLVDYFVLGNRIPNPAISTDIGGVLNIIQEFEYNGEKISVKEMESENKNRKSILSRVLPFKRVER